MYLLDNILLKEWAYSLCKLCTSFTAVQSTQQKYLKYQILSNGILKLLEVKSKILQVVSTIVF